MAGRVSRRRLLLGTGALALAGCVRVPGRPAAPAPRPLTGEAAWRAEGAALSLLALSALNTFETFAAFRIGAASESALRTPNDLPWDPPTEEAWTAALHATGALRQRAATLLQSIASAPSDDSNWRRQRALADNAHAFNNLADAMDGYISAIHELNPVGDGSVAQAPLQQSWTVWTVVAEGWGIQRAQAVA